MTLLTSSSRDGINHLNKATACHGHRGEKSQGVYYKTMHLKHDDGDLSTSEYLDESTIVETLFKRFSRGEYYTYIGEIIVAINPCQPVRIYEVEDHERYRNLYERRSQKPHIYWMADEVYRCLRETSQNQCIIVSGESGAGKTENTKHILNHLIRLGPNNISDLISQLDQVNPLLELFGNASTALNKNSSRFCKFIELQYSDAGQLLNGQIQSFILEKCRLIHRQKNEKNFHIFYALLGGLQPDLKEKFFLGEAAEYRIVQGEDEMAPVFDDNEDYNEYIHKFAALEEALQKIGFDNQEVTNMYNVLSAVLNLTNVNFEVDEEAEDGEIDVPNESKIVINNVENLLTVPEGILNEALVKKYLVVKGQKIMKRKRIVEANEGRDALAKELYSLLFSCVIDQINSKLKESVSSDASLQTSKKSPSISLLDISGFEKLSVNGFEQLLINTANEVLHQIFLNQVIKREQEEYEKEGIRWRDIEFHDNKDVIDLILKSGGSKGVSIFSILEDQASLQKISDEGLVQKLNENCSQNRRYIRRNETELSFGIIHYADKISNLKSFQKSLRQLQTKLNQSRLLFVRCLKPNALLKPNKFDHRCMQHQLRASGLTEAANLRRDGFPIRMPFAKFSKRYGALLKYELQEQLIDPQKKCELIIHEMKLQNYGFGKTKVMLKYHDKDILEYRLKEYEEHNFGNITSNIAASTRSSFSSNGPVQETRINFMKHKLDHLKEINRSETTERSVMDEESFSKDDSCVPSYDFFRETEREIDNEIDIFNKLLKILRILFYLFTICGILVTGVVNRITLQLMATSKPHSKTAHSKLIISLVVPTVIFWLLTLIKSAFRKTEWPSKKLLFSVFLFECVQITGKALFLFRILPTLGLFRTSVMILATGQVPAVMLLLEQIFGAKFQKLSTRCLGLLFYSLACCIQIGVLPVFYITNFFTWTTDKDETISDTEKWIVPIAVVLTSLTWWENFAFFDIQCCRLSIPLKRLRNRIEKTREATEILTVPLKMVLLFCLSLALSQQDIKQFLEDWKKSTGQGMYTHFQTYGIMYVHIVSGIICCYLAGMACKLHMQKMGFSLPLILITPVSVGINIAQCTHNIIPSYLFKEKWSCFKIEIPGETLTPILLLGLLFISILIITNHIWVPGSERMSQIKRLFVLPHYEPLFPDMGLLLRRRQDVKEKSFRVKKDGLNENNLQPKILICATAWHETQQEMLQLQKSLFRLDLEQVTKKLAQNYVRNYIDVNSYELEIHIIFDDSWETDANHNRVPNGFVRQFVELIPEAAESVAKGFIRLNDFKKVSTPYGGRLELVMPGDTHMVIHLKDKDKIRHKKRWSQVMYMYYLLGYKMFGDRGSDSEICIGADGPGLKKRKTKGHSNASILNHLSDDDFKRIEKTFILTLDGDVDFKPNSVKLLIDRMQKNSQVGAVCGRIHPVGTGPMVWYQQFEYAVGHWLQKAAEHVFGCVLCCPGCFSLFRASAIMDDNVIRAYTRKAVRARDFIQYEQGEDRWLCTLLLQQGYKIDYCAGADAYTFAPESFHDFFIQRRRWAPSTIANIMDLLSTWKITVSLNDNISVLFILYQFILMISSILAPATVVLMIAGSYSAVLKLSMWKSFALSVVPVILFIAVCLKAKTNTQIMFAAFMTSIYTVVMVIVTVGTLVNILEEDLISPNVVFLAGLGVIFSICGLLHPREIVCLIHGVLYFLTVPSSFIFLTVYFLCNLNNVSWGTRENPKTSEDEETNTNKKTDDKQKTMFSLFNLNSLKPILEDLKKFLYDILGKKPSDSNTSRGNVTVIDVESQKPATQLQSIQAGVKVIRTRAADDFSHLKIDPFFWRKLPYLGEGEECCVDEDEVKFWNYMLRKYLHPLKEDKEEKERIKRDLITTRNNIVFGYFLLNLLWSVAVMQLQTMKHELLPFFILKKYEPISVIFLTVFGLVLVFQFIGMCMHRWGTFLHLMSTTHIMSNEVEKNRMIENVIRSMASASRDIDIQPDYSSEEDESVEEEHFPAEDYPVDDMEEERVEPKSVYEKIYYDRWKTIRKDFNKRVPKHRRGFYKDTFLPSDNHAYTNQVFQNV
ncbi:chitin synthase chs-1 [Argonauta hians]